MNWSNITISQWQRIQAAAVLTDDMILQWLNILPILTGKPREEFKAMTLTNFNIEVAKFAFLSTLPTEIVKSVIEINGKRFSFNMDIKAITADQFITLSELVKDKEKITENLHKIMAVFFLSKSGFNGEDFKANADLFRDHMTVDIAYPLQLFFCNLLVKSLPLINRSLSQAGSRSHGSQSIGAGTSYLTKWRGKMLPGGKRSLK